MSKGDKHLTYFNTSAERITGFSHDTVISKKCKNVFRSFICKENCPIKTVIETEQPIYHYKKSILTKSNRKVIIDSCMSPLKNCDGKTIGIVEVFRDATELKKLEREIIYSEKLAAIGKLAAGISHEINNPIGSILAAIEVVLQKIENRSPGTEDIETVIKYLKSIEGEAIRCGNIIRNFLNFSREFESKKIPTDVNKILKDVIFLISPQSSRQKVSVEKNLSSNLPDILADAIQLKQVFMNVILNSLDAMLRGGKLSITSKFDIVKSLVIVKITDTGCGIAKEKLPHLFDLFYTSKEIGKGTGLGLPVSREIIERHNGSIEVQSKVGKGTSFIVSFPK